MKHLNLIKDNSVIVSAMLIFFAFLKLNWYYNYFGINISDYLNISEVLVCLFRDIWIFIQVFAMIYGVSILIYILFEILDRYVSKIFEEKYKQLTSIPEIWVALFLIGTIIWSILLAKGYINFTFFSEYFLILSISQFISKTISVLNDNPNSSELKNTNIISANSEFYFTIIVCFFVSIYFHAKKEYLGTIKKSNTVTFNNGEIINCSERENLLLVGKTQDYLFTYTISLKQYHVYPLNSIKSISGN